MAKKKNKKEPEKPNFSVDDSHEERLKYDSEYKAQYESYLHDLEVAEHLGAEYESLILSLPKEYIDLEILEEETGTYYCLECKIVHFKDEDNVFEKHLKFRRQT